MYMIFMLFILNLSQSKSSLRFLISYNVRSFETTDHCHLSDFFQSDTHTNVPPNSLSPLFLLFTFHSGDDDAVPNQGGPLSTACILKTSKRSPITLL